MSDHALGPVQNPPPELQVRKITITIELDQVTDQKISVKWDRSPTNDECKGKLMTMQMITALMDLNKRLQEWIKMNDETGVTSE